MQGRGLGPGHSCTVSGLDCEGKEAKWLQLPFRKVFSPLGVSFSHSGSEQPPPSSPSGAQFSGAWPSPGPGPGHAAAGSPADLTAPCALAWPSREKIARLENQEHFLGERPPCLSLPAQGLAQSPPTGNSWPGTAHSAVGTGCPGLPTEAARGTVAREEPGTRPQLRYIPSPGWLGAISPIATATPPSMGPCTLTSSQPQGIHHPPFPARLPQVGASGELRQQGLHLPPHWDASGRQ